MIQFPQLFFYMAGQIPCTCGCGLEVTYATKWNHLNCCGKTSLQARLVLEVRFLKRNTQQQAESTPLLQRGFKKWASSNLDRDDSCKWHKAAQLKGNKLSEIATSSQLETDLIEDLLPPVAADTDQQGRFIERSQGMMEMHWMTSRQDDGYSNGKGSNNDGRDEEEEEDKDEDEDELAHYDSEIPGISNWDLLGKDFECEAAALALYPSYESATQLTTF